MTERQPISSADQHDPPIGDPSPADDRLPVSPDAGADRRAGDHRLVHAAEEPLPLELQPGRAVQLSWAGGQIEVSLGTRGDVMLRLTPAPDPSESATTAREAAAAIELSAGIETSLPAHPGGPEGAPQTPLEPPMNTEGAERRRVNLAGRVGADPTVRRTPRGKTIARFPLAVREPGQEQPTWHQILTFDQRAQKVKETVQKGQEVTVIGYPHQREVKQKDGSTRVVEEIYAVVVRAAKSDAAPRGTDANA